LKSSDAPIIVYTDGACDPNPGPGGWAALIIHPDGEKVISGGDSETTNNRMELTAAIKALKSFRKPSSIEIYTDSQYLQKGIEEWMEKWQARNWKGSSGKVANQDLWKMLLNAAKPHKVTWHWLQGHAGNSLNQRVDRLARRAIPR